MANQQKDGDSPIQNIIMGLKEKCKERITNGLRSFIASDNHSAVEVGHLPRGQRPFNVSRPEMNGYRPEVLREGADDLTLRAENFGTLKACIDVDHIDKHFWRWFSVQQHDDQSKEHPLEGTYLDQSRGQQVCVSAFRPDTLLLVHDERVNTVREEPNLHITSTC